jgi:hypothetical protein
MINQAHMPRSDQPLRTILARMRHEHCGGRAAKAELLTGVRGVSRSAVHDAVHRAPVLHR